MTAETPLPNFYHMKNCNSRRGPQYPCDCSRPKRFAQPPADDAVVEKISRGLDPMAWKFIDTHAADDPPHPAVPLTRARAVEHAATAIALVRRSSPPVEGWNEAIEAAAQSCDREAAACLGDVHRVIEACVTDELGAKFAKERASALVTAAADIRALKRPSPASTHKEKA
jgi:hypothetical protein